MQVSKSKKFKTYDSYTTSDKNYNVYRTKGTYYIMVRSYKQIGNTKYYGSFSSVKAVTIKQKYKGKRYRAFAIFTGN